MTKTKLILISLMLSSTLAAGAEALASQPRAPRQPFAHLRGFAAARIADRFAEPEVGPADKGERKAAVRRKAPPDDGQYTIIDEPDADPGLYGTRVFFTNESGQISGQFVDSSGVFHAFIGTPNGDGTFGFAPVTVHASNSDTFGLFLNDRQEMCGGYVDYDTGIENTWYRSRRGEISAFQLPDGPNGSGCQGMNNKGVLVGYYLDANEVYHAFTRTRDGTLTELADAENSGNGSGEGTQGIGINNLGDIAGAVIDSSDVVHGFIRHADGSFEYFDDPNAGIGAFQGTQGFEINDRGWVTGQYIDSADVFHGFIRNPEGKFTTVDAPDAGTGPQQGTQAVEHREAGWSVGEYIDSSDVYRGYFRASDGTITKFDAPGAGTLGTYTVYSSNKKHVIAGTFKDENGIRHGFIRNP